MSIGNIDFTKLCTVFIEQFIAILYDIIFNVFRIIILINHLIVIPCADSLIFDAG